MVIVHKLRRCTLTQFKTAVRRKLPTSMLNTVLFRSRARAIRPTQVRCSIFGVGRSVRSPTAGSFTPLAAHADLRTLSFVAQVQPFALAISKHTRSCPERRLDTAASGNKNVIGVSMTVIPESGTHFPTSTATQSASRLRIVSRGSWSISAAREIEINSLS